MLLDRKVIVADVSPLVRSLLEQPAIWGVPLSVDDLMVVLSKLMTPKLVPVDVHLKMLRIARARGAGIVEELYRQLT